MHASQQQLQENESGSDVRADGNGDEKISGSEQPSVEEGGDGTADPESDFRLALNLTDEEKIDVTIRSVAEIEEEERLAAEMAEKLSWLDELWQLEQETEEELRLADAESDEELEKRREMGTKGELPVPSSMYSSCYTY